jgi:hypothetical protein
VVVPAKKADGPLIGNLVDQDAKQRRLAGPVQTNQGMHAPTLEASVDSPQDFDISQPDVDIA